MSIIITDPRNVLSFCYTVKKKTVILVFSLHRNTKLEKYKFTDHAPLRDLNFTIIQVILKD